MSKFLIDRSERSGPIPANQSVRPRWWHNDRVVKRPRRNAGSGCWMSSAVSPVRLNRSIPKISSDLMASTMNNSRSLWRNRLTERRFSESNEGLDSRLVSVDRIWTSEIACDYHPSKLNHAFSCYRSNRIRSSRNNSKCALRDKSRLKVTRELLFLRRILIRWSSMKGLSGDFRVAQYRFILTRTLTQTCTSNPCWAN